jgi:ATP-binding cassette subfamily B protein
MPNKERSFLGDIGSVWAHRRDIWRLLSRADKLSLASAVLLMTLVAAAETRIAFLFGSFWNEVAHFAGHPVATWLPIVVRYLSFLGVLYLLKESIIFTRRWVMGRATSRIQSDLTIRLVGHLLKVNLEALARQRAGALHGRISRSVEGFVKFVRVAFTDFIPAILTGLFAVGGAFLADWRVGIVMLLVIPISVVITIWQVVSQRTVRDELIQAQEGLDATVVEQLSGLEYIRAANTYGLEAARVRAVSAERGSREVKHGLAMTRFDWMKAINEDIFQIAIIGYAIMLAARGQMEFGAVITFYNLFMNVMRPLREVHRILDETYDSSSQVTILLHMLSQPLDQSYGVVTLRPPRLDGTIPLLECQDLVANYTTPTGETRAVLNGVTLAIHQGQSIGIAGRSGSGKSTWLRCVLRLVHPSSGEVLVGGVPIGVLSREDIGKSIGYVSQVPFVFSGTVADNISYGCGAATRAQIEDAARQAHIHEEVLQMPRGYDTVLTERGGNLSGGQRQRIALARMFLKNPPVLILDEGTSALDNISERRVRAAIDTARQSHTVIMVAHRLSTLNQTDCIFVFDQGRIAEQGPFHDLVQRNGVFAELVRSAEAA